RPSSSSIFSPPSSRFPPPSGTFCWSSGPHLMTPPSAQSCWPYCLRRCSYCNFNKYIPRENKDSIMTECLRRETETLLQLSQVSCITSVFFGGGSPSLADPSTIAAVLETVSKQASLSDQAEVTLEVNPTPAGRMKLEGFHLAGVNRFSVGVQSLQDEDLRSLGRDHNSQEALQTIEEARRLCPGRVSVDVMFGLPKQTLTLERGTQLFKKVQSGEVSMPAEEVTAEIYQHARETLHQHGFVQYEVSNFARNNSESDHNLSYWRGKQYIGVGPGAHGRFVPLGEGVFAREARTQTLEPDAWIREVQQMGHGTRRRILMSRLDLLEEVLVMGMRMAEGISHKHWDVFCPQMGLREVFSESMCVQELLQGGQLILDDRGLRCTWNGLALLDCILPTLLAPHQTLHQHDSPLPGGLSEM
uniref:Radical S-adenosyl methionine domain containing 1 n=1 Tax=Oryzias latipes TaxID=8090 RepID=A0A3P9LL46_ORYLA